MQKQEQEEKYEQVPLGDGSGNTTASYSANTHSGDYAPYPKVENADPVQLQKEREAWTAGASSQPTTVPSQSYSGAPPPPPVGEGKPNPYVEAKAISDSNNKGFVGNVRDVLGRWGKKVGDTTKRAEDFTGGVWQHLKTGPSIADTAMERIAQGAKVLAEGGFEKIFKQTFEVQPDEELKKTFACYLSTTAGPVIGTLYLSTHKLAFCSDEPLSYKVDAEKTEWSFYKVVLPLYQLRAVNSSANRSNPSEKYIQVISVDNHEFWFMGFVNYDRALKSLQALLNRDGQ
eukprot:TRINITY_DN1363_c0_g1_i1.p1 TRINITY_DN1363_c0_g1~~TRINITY_DN1363_c0_g1_i1.p1  ORF type:complete len:287 (+),score=57.83 TRINITY_DN1363_c0_g1_i1:187-1047(+)